MPNKEKGYNGWSNYETWNVKLWLDNDQGSAEYWEENAQEAFKRAKAGSYFTRSDDARRALADRLKDEIEEGVPVTEGLYADLLNATISEVNWSEIANAFLEDNEVEDDGEKYEGTE
jgi:hypothetical protein